MDSGHSGALRSTPTTAHTPLMFREYKCANLIIVAAGSLNRPGGVVDADFFKKYEALKEENEAMRKRCADLMGTNTGIVNKLELSQVRTKLKSFN